MPKVTIEGKSGGGGRRGPAGPPQPPFGVQRGPFDAARGENSGGFNSRREQQEYNQRFGLYDKALSENWKIDGEREFAVTQRNKLREDAAWSKMQESLRSFNKNMQLRAAHEKTLLDEESKAEEDRLRALKDSAFILKLRNNTTKRTAQQEEKYDRDYERANEMNDRFNARRFNNDYRLASYLNRDMDRAAGGGKDRMYLPFVGALGLGNTGELLGELIGSALGGMPGGVAGYLAAKTVEELAMAPQKIASLERSGLSSAQPYIDLKKASFAASRAGGAGFSGDGLFRSFFPGYYELPPWMAAAGIGPQTAMSTMQGFGIAPRSAEQGTGIARSLSMLQFLPGLSGVDALPLMTTLGKYGMVAPNAGGITAGGAELGHIMENAIERGMNRTEVLRSIDAAVSTAARGGGIGQSVGGLADFMYRFSGMPGGMTGEVGLHAIAGVQGAMSTVGSNTIRTMMTGTAAVGRYNTEAKLRQLLNRDSPGFYEKMTGSSVGRAALDNYFAAVKAGDMYGASIWLRELTNGNPAAQTELLTQPGFMSGPGYMRDIEGATLSGLTPTEYIASRINPGAALSAVPSQIGSDLALSGYTSPGGGGGGAEARMTGSNRYALNAFDEGSVDAYRAALLQQGINPKLVDTVIAAARRHGFDPRVYGAILRNESAGGNDPRITPGGAYGLTGIENPAQISGSSHLPKPTSPEMSIEEGAQILAQNMRAPGATLRSVVRGYRGPDMNEKYWQRFVSGLSAGGDGRAQADLYRVGANVEQAEMQGAATSFHELVEIVPRVNVALNTLIKVFQRAAIDFAAASRTSSGPFSWEGMARMGGK